MSLNAVLQYTKSLLDELQSPLLSPLEAVVQPPVLSDVADHPYCFIWGAHSPIKRQTAPRAIRLVGGGIQQGGYQQADWQITCRLYTVLAQTDPDIEMAFPGLVDAVILELSTTPIAIVTTDPLTGQQLQILTIGESMTIDYASAVAVANGTGQGIIRFGCDVQTLVQEKLAPSEGLAG
jgi:hypothetical protein